MKRLGAASKFVRRKRTFKSITEDKIGTLQQKQLKKRTLAKVQWAIRAYNEWRVNRLQDSDSYDQLIFEANLEDLEHLSKNALKHALCRFVPEVTKIKDGADYPGKTLYEMVVCIQKHLNENGLNWKLIDDFEFKELKTVIDNVMKERSESNIGTSVHHAGFIPFKLEDEMWKKNMLGEDSTEKLRSTILFLLGIHCGLRAGDEHYDLHRDGPKKKSQFSFEKNSKGQTCVVYQEDTITNTNNGGLNSMKNERKVVWIYPSTDTIRCPVRLLDKYMSLLPPVKNESSKHNFYLRSLERPNPAQWYSTQVVGLNTLRKTIGD